MLHMQYIFCGLNWNIILNPRGNCVCKMDFPPAAYNSCFGLSKMNPNGKDGQYCQSQIALRFLGRFNEQGVEIIANFYTTISGNVRKKMTVSSFWNFENKKFSHHFFKRSIFLYLKSDVVWFFSLILQALLSKFPQELVWHWVILRLRPTPYIALCEDVSCLLLLRWIFSQTRL